MHKSTYTDLVTKAEFIQTPTIEIKLNSQVHFHFELIENNWIM